MTDTLARSLAEARLSHTYATWSVQMTNGSGTRYVELTGTQATAWTWATEAGRRGGIAAGTWYPVAITATCPCCGEFARAHNSRPCSACGHTAPAEFEAL